MSVIVSRNLFLETSVATRQASSSKKITWRVYVPSFDQEITITIKTKDGETINLEELILTIFETEQGKEIIRELIRNELIELIGGYDERH